MRSSNKRSQLEAKARAALYAQARSVARQDPLNAVDRRRKKRITRNVSTDRGKEQLLTVHRHGTDRNLGSSEDGRQRKAERSATEKRRNGAQLSAQSCLPSRSNGQTRGIGEHERLQRGALSCTFELIAKGNALLTAAALAPLFEEKHTRTDLECGHL